MKKIFLLIIIVSLNLSAQNWFFMPDFWEVHGKGLAFNIESFDMNKDEHLDIVTGNWNDTYVYYGGYGILDKTVDVKYQGRMLAICDYNGDGYKDMITMHFTNYDSSRYDYNGELLFYWGSDTTALAIDTIVDYSIPLPTIYPTIERFTEGNFTVGIQEGDLNGDGKTDLVFSSTKVVDTSGNIDYNGKIYIYMGKELPSDTADFVLTGSNDIAFLGDFVQVGNINGDKYDDLLISSNQPRTIGIRYDSVNYLHIFYGSDNFKAILGNESKIYSSFVNPPDSIAGWFLRRFSVDDINGDGIDDIVIGRSFYDYPHKTAVHYGSVNGIDTIPSFTFIQDTTFPDLFSAGGVTQKIGDFNMDGYDDFIMSPAGYQVFVLYLGGPHVSNGNRYGVRGYSNAGDIFPRKAVNMGDQTNDGVNDIAAIVPGGGPYYNGYILMMYGQTIPTDVKENKNIKPESFKLYQNYPNPFNPSTVISWQLSESGFVTLKVYDSLGREITTLINQQQNGGKHEIKFNAEKYNLSSGVYIYTLKTKGGEINKKMTYLK